MKICIIDMDTDRLDKLQKLCTLRGDHVIPLESRDGGKVIDPAEIDLLLLHAGIKQQQDMGDSIQQIIDEFEETQILCFTGGIPVEAARAESNNLALFIGSTEALMRTVKAVLNAWPLHSERPRHWLRSLVNGIDWLLEAKLDVLTSLYQNKPPSIESITEIQKQLPQLVSYVEDPHSYSIDKILELRELFFDDSK